MQDYKGEDVVEALVDLPNVRLNKDEQSLRAIPRPGKPLHPFPFSDVPMTPGATHRVVGYLPEVGTELTVNGLKYRVSYLNHGRGRFTADIVRGKKAKP